MIQFELSIEQAKHIKEEVTTRLAELDHEIAHTDSPEFKEMLKHRRESLRIFLEKLPDSVALAA